MDGAGETGTLAVDLRDLTNEACGPCGKEERIQQHRRTDRVDREGLGCGAANRGLGQTVGWGEHKAREEI